MLVVGRRIDHQTSRRSSRGSGAATSQTAYTASKGAVLAMTREIAVEYARKGIRLQRALPWAYRDALLLALLSDEEKEATPLRPHPHGPARRRAEELAKAALFLAVGRRQLS
jgi:NAD(P)-dependent dehydrogenase (short-subunit alcohol dehydrogenase family)